MSHTMHKIDSIFISCVMFTVPVLFVVLLSAFAFFFILVPIFGWSQSTVLDKYYKCMRIGDGEKAIVWAKRVEYYRRRERIYQNSLLPVPIPIRIDGSELVAAYEMNGQYKKALKRHLRGDYVASDHYQENDLPRLLYKLGRKEDAFKAYCANIQPKIKQLAGNPREEFTQLMNSFRDDVMCKNHADYMRLLCPFKDYEEFHKFMWETYHTIPDREQYDDVMKKI